MIRNSLHVILGTNVHRCVECDLKEVLVYVQEITIIKYELPK